MALTDAVTVAGGEPAAHSSDADASPTETKGERTRRRLLDLAVERFGGQGFRGTSVTEIARDAGLTQAAVYAYFPSKEALFRAAVDVDAAGLIADSLPPLESIPVRQLAPAFLLVAMAALERHPLAGRVLGGLEREVAPTLRELTALDGVTDAVAARIAEAQETGEIRPDIDPTVMADGITALVVAMLMSAVHTEEAVDNRYQVGVVEVFDAALRPVQT